MSYSRQPHSPTYPKILVFVLPGLELSSEANLACLPSLELGKRPTPQADGGTGHGETRYMGVCFSAFFSVHCTLMRRIRYSRMVTITESLERGDHDRLIESCPHPRSIKLK